MEQVLCQISPVSTQPDVLSNQIQSNILYQAEVTVVHSLQFTCSLTSWAYNPFLAISSSCVPSSSFRPKLMDTILSAFRTVDNRWAITIVVLPTSAWENQSISQQARKQIINQPSNQPPTNQSINQTMHQAGTCLVNPNHYSNGCKRYSIHCLICKPHNCIAYTSNNCSQ